MAKYMLLYKGNPTDMSEISEEKREEIMKHWQRWTENIGKALIDIGNPFSPAISVIDNGSTAKPVNLNGYSIIEANSTEDAHTLTKGHPFLSEGAGNFSVEIFELLPVPM